MKKRVKEMNSWSSLYRITSSDGHSAIGIAKSRQGVYTTAIIGIGVINSLGYIVGFGVECAVGMEYEYLTNFEPNYAIVF